MSRSCSCGSSPCTHWEYVDLPVDPHWAERFEAAYRAVASDLSDRLLPLFGQDVADRYVVAYDQIDVRPAPIPTLSVLPRVELDNGDASLYGTSGELEARGWWMRDVESDQGLGGETKA